MAGLTKQTKETLMFIWLSRLVPEGKWEVRCEPSLDKDKLVRWVRSNNETADVISPRREHGLFRLTEEKY